MNIKLFILIRNVNLALSGARGFILAHLLGPTSYGVLGGLIAVQQMMSYSALGMREGVLIQLSKLTRDDHQHVAIYSSAIAFAAGVGALLPIICAAYWLGFYSRLNVEYLLIAVIGGVSVLNEVLININRHEGHLARVSFCESSYNLLILILIFVLYRFNNVTLVLVYMLAAGCFSTTVYLSNLTFFSLRSVSWRVTKDLIATGFLSRILSAVLIVINLVFIIVAQRHLPKPEVGQFVFANNIATLVLVSLSAFSWAMTSRSMSDLADAGGQEAVRRRIARTDLYLRLGIAGALIVSLSISVALPWVTERYAESAKYVLLFVALQSFQLIVFTELNFLMMKNRVSIVIAIFAVANVVNYALIETLSGWLSFPTIMVIAIFATAAATLSAVSYAEFVGLGTIDIKAKYASVVSILVAVVLFSYLGIWVALLYSVAFLLFVVFRNRTDILPAAA